MADIPQTTTEYAAGLASRRAFDKARRKGKNVFFCRRFSNVVRAYYMSNSTFAVSQYQLRKR